jgi:hypothetical protein
VGAHYRVWLFLRAKEAIMKRNFLPLILICGFAQLPAFSQGVVTTTNPFTTSPVAVPQPIVGSVNLAPVISVGFASPLKPVRTYYPKTIIQNPSNPWLAPNLQQVNTGLIPVGSISPTSVLIQPTSSLNTPGSAQQAGFPTVPVYNIGTNTPTAQSTVAGGSSFVQTGIGTTNPGNLGINTTQNLNSIPRLNAIPLVQ